MKKFICLFLFISLVLISGCNIQKKENLTYSDLFIKVNDKYTGEPLKDVNIRITGCGEFQSVSNGDVWEVFNVTNNRTCTMYFWNEFYPTVAGVKSIGLEAEKDYLYAEVEPLPKNLVITQIEEFNNPNGLNNITVKVSSDGLFEKTEICYRLTPGLIYFINKDSTLKCDDEDKMFDIKDNNYFCNNDRYLCSSLSADNSTCIFKEIPIPDRLKGKVNKCFLTEKSIDPNFPYTFNFEAKTFNANNNDYIDLWLIDRFRIEENNWERTDQTNSGEDLFFKDLNYRIEFSNK